MWMRLVFSYSWRHFRFSFASNCLTNHPTTKLEKEETVRCATVRLTCWSTAGVAPAPHAKHIVWLRSFVYQSSPSNTNLYGETSLIPEESLARGEVVSEWQNLGWQTGDGRALRPPLQHARRRRRRDGMCNLTWGSSSISLCFRLQNVECTHKSTQMSTKSSWCRYTLHSCIKQVSSTLTRWKASRKWAHTSSFWNTKT
jgi:hypothetical protein